MKKSELQTLLNKKLSMIDKEHCQSALEIHWKVVASRHNLIDIYNDCSESHFKIVVESDGDMEVIDELMETTIIYLLCGSEWYQDFSAYETGIEKAINALLSYFYYTY